MKIGSVIVTYNPEIIQLKKNLSATNKQVFKIIVVDNGSKNIRKIEKLVGEFSNVKLVQLFENKGIAKAQNTGFLKLLNEGFEWVLTLDQDTIIPFNYVDKLLPAINNKNHIGIVTGAYIDVKWDATKIKYVRKSRHPLLQEVNEEISSGNIVSTKVWMKVGGFDENLFIDYVDFDFDYKLSEAGYHVYRLNNVEFKHEIGIPIEKSWLTKILLLNSKELFDHSARRLYYINRNRIIVRRRYPQYGSPFRMFIREILNLREILVMKGPRMLKLKNSVIGIIQGVFHRTRG